MDNNNGITIINNNNEILIKGTKEDLEILANTILKLISSNLNKDHIHIDELTLISNNSPIKELIIEKQ